MIQILGELAWASAGAFLALVGLGITTYSGIRWGVVPGLKGVHQFVEKWEAALKLINAELRFNGGSSLLDIIHDDHRKLGKLAQVCPALHDAPDLEEEMETCRV